MGEPASAPPLGRDLAGHSKETEVGTEGCWWSGCCGTEVQSQAKTRGSHSLIVELDTGRQCPNPHLAVPNKEPPSAVVPELTRHGGTGKVPPPPRCLLASAAPASPAVLSHPHGRGFPAGARDKSERGISG